MDGIRSAGDKDMKQRSLLLTLACLVSCITPVSYGFTLSNVFSSAPAPASHLRTAIRWVQKHPTISISCAVATAGLVGIAAWLIKQQWSKRFIPVAPPVPTLDPAHYERPVRPVHPVPAAGQPVPYQSIHHDILPVQPIPVAPPLPVFEDGDIVPGVPVLSEEELQKSSASALAMGQAIAAQEAAQTSSPAAQVSNNSNLDKSATVPAQPIVATSVITPPAPSSMTVLSSSSATHIDEPSSRTVLSSSTSKSTTSLSQGRRSPSASEKANADYREGVAKALWDLTQLEREQIQIALDYLPPKTLPLSSEIRARLGLADNLTSEQLHTKLKEICERYEAGRQLFQKICAQHQDDLSNSWVTIESSQNLPGEQALSNLMWFFYLYAGLHNERNIFQEGTFRIIDNVDDRLTNFFEFILGAEGIQKRLSSHFKQCQSYGIDIDTNKCPLPPYGKRHLLLGQPASNEIYLKPEKFGVSGFSDGIYHFGDFVITRMSKNDILRWLFNLESDSAPQNRKEHLPDDLKEQLAQIKKQISRAKVPETIQALVPHLTEMLQNAVDHELTALAGQIQNMISDILQKYPDWKKRVGNEVILDVDELLNAPEIVIENNSLQFHN